VSANELIPLYRPWFDTLIPQWHESRMTAHPWSYDTHATIDAMLEIGTCDYYKCDCGIKAKKSRLLVMQCVWCGVYLRQHAAAAAVAECENAGTSDVTDAR